MLVHSRSIRKLSASLSFRKYTGLALVEICVHTWTNHFENMNAIDGLSMLRICTNSWTKHRMSSIQLHDQKLEKQFFHGTSKCYDEIIIMDRKPHNTSFLKGRKSWNAVKRHFIHHKKYQQSQNNAKVWKNRKNKKAILTMMDK